MLEQCCKHSKQHRNNVVMPCCAKNRRCESSRVTSPLLTEAKLRLRRTLFFRDLKGDVTRDNSHRRFLAQHSVAMVEQCCKHLKQCRNNVVMLRCAKNRRCESSRVTSP